MSHRRIKRPTSNPWKCECDNPDCGNSKMARLCDHIGRTLPKVRPSQIPKLFGILNTKESIGHFLNDHCISHNPERILAGEDSLPPNAFVLEFLNDQDWWSLEVLSPSPMPCTYGHDIQ